MFVRRAGRVQQGAAHGEVAGGMIHYKMRDTAPVALIRSV